jgi:DNA polymerase-1
VNVLLVDGSALVYRAYFAFASRPLVSSRGEPTSVAFASLGTLLRWFRNYAPQTAAVVFDAPGETHRHRMDPNYKANRPPRPAGLVEQMPRVLQALDALRLRLPGERRQGLPADPVAVAAARRAVARHRGRRGDRPGRAAAGARARTRGHRRLDGADRGRDR